MTAESKTKRCRTIRTAAAGLALTAGLSLATARNCLFRRESGFCICGGKQDRK